jgi:hypothetical protein
MKRERALSDFLRPTKVTIISFFVLVCCFFYFYYVYGFIDTINTFLIGDPVEYRDNFIAISDGDPWALGVAFQLTVFLSFLYIFASFISLVLGKALKRFK